MSVNMTISIGLFIIITFIYLYLHNEKSAMYNCAFFRQLRNPLPDSRKFEGYVILGSFLLIFIVDLFFYLNQWPGSLSCDTPGQLAQAVGDAKLENLNPLINTVVIKACVQLVLFLQGTVSGGVALYTFLQMIFMVLVSVYAVWVIYKQNIGRGLVYFAILFFAFSPINIAYYIGMWKDTFFAGWFLLCISRIFYCYQKDSMSKKDILLNLIVVVTACLARNSGWSAILMWLPFIYISCRKQKKSVKNNLVISCICGVFISLFIITVVYGRIIETKNSDVTTGISIPLQQIARVVAYDDDLTPEQEELLSRICDVDNLGEVYNPGISDPVKGAISDQEYLKDNAGTYAKLWLDIGKTHVLTYIKAYYYEMRQYLVPGTYVWLYDNRIFDNPYGVERKGLIFGQFDLVGVLLYRFRTNGLVCDQGRLFWVLMFFLIRNRKKEHRLFYLPALFIYIGLLVTAPVSLFRYVYAVYLMLPYFIVWDNMKNESGQKKNELEEMKLLRK